MIKDANFQDIPGSVRHRIIEKIGAEDEFYNRINRMKVFIFQLVPFIHMNIYELSFFFSFLRCRLFWMALKKCHQMSCSLFLMKAVRKQPFPLMYVVVLRRSYLVWGCLASCCYFVERNLVGLSFI